MLMQATSSHTHGNTHWCARVRMSLVVGVPSEGICYSVSGS